MKSSVSFRWKRLVSKIHPPLPMTPRGSARILSLLNTSFKRQLDLQHPTGLLNSEQHTDRHLQSILTNPLFATKDDTRGTGGKGKSKVFGQVQDLVKRPMDVFKEQVSAGTATIQSAGLCLQAEYNKCLASSEAKLADAMSASKAGTTVLDWVLSDVGRWGLIDAKLSLKLLVSFLVAERRHERTLQWLQVLYIEGRNDQSKANIGRFRSLLYEFIKAEVSLGQGAESATGLFMQAVCAVRDNAINFHGLGNTFNAIAYLLTEKLMDMPKSKKLQEMTLDPFIHICKHFAKPKSIVPALLSTYLVKHPSPDAALRYFRQPSYDWRTVIKPKIRPTVIFLGLKTAELCLDQNRQTEAVQIMDFLQENFKDEVTPRQISYSNVKERRSEAAEHESLRLLDSLAIA